MYFHHRFVCALSMSARRSRKLYHATKWTEWSPHCQVSAVFSRCLQHMNFVLQGKNTANEATAGVSEPLMPDIVAPKTITAM